MESEIVEKIREFCLAQPGVFEKLSHGEPSWFTKKRQFAMFADHHHDDRVAIWCMAPPGIQAVLVGEQPQRFFRPPYVGVRGWVGIYLDREVDWSEVHDCLAEAYKLAIQ